MNGSTTFPALADTANVGIEAEARLIALGFSNLSALDSILGQVQPRHFADDLHRKVWRVLTEARQQGEREIDIVTVHHRLGGPPDLLPDLAAIEQQSPGVQVTADRVQSLAGTVLALARRREQESALQAAAALAFDLERPAAQRLEEARKLLENAEQAQVSRFAMVPVSGLHEQEPPSFVWDDLLPVGYVTLWGAHGGTGKSLMALMLAVHVAMGLPMFGVPTRQGRVVFFSGEDEGGVLRHRLNFICERLSINPSDLEGKLHLIDATGHDPVLYAQQDNRGRGGTTPTYDALRAYVREVKPVLLILDNASDLFAGSEIDRTAVRAFMRHAALLGRESAAATLLLAHVDKGTSRNSKPENDEGYSGSTAWNNSARSRLFMSRDKDGTITLAHQKSNLGKKRDPIRLFWPEGGLPQVDLEFGPVVQGIADRNHEKALLKLIHEFTQRGEFIRTATTCREHAAKLLKNEPTYPKLKDNEVFDLLRRCERSGFLARVAYKNSARHDRERWEVTAAGMGFAGVSAPTASTAPTSDF